MKKRASILWAVLLIAALLAGCGGTAVGKEAPSPSPSVSPEPAAPAVPTAEEAEAETPAEGDGIDPNAQRLADIKTAIREQKQGKYGMLPIYGRDVNDGVYDIHADSSSPFFRITQAQLIVKDGEMSGRITIPSMSYLWVYPGTRKEADAASQSRWYGFEEVDHQTVFTFPVEALDKPLDCAAYSKARKKWYDRTLVFYASSLPEDALKVDLPDYEMIEAALEAFDLEGVEEILSAPRPEAPSAVQAMPMAVDIPDGEYSIEVNMTGGSGRASVSSPTLMIVRGGRAYARLLWSSAYYDYMTIDTERFLNMTTDGGNSTFEIPITVMDDPMQVIGDTTAMGDPLEIEYALTFYSDSIGNKGLIPQEAAKKVLVIAGVIIVAGGVLNYFVKKKRAA